MRRLLTAIAAIFLVLQAQPAIAIDAKTEQRIIQQLKKSIPAKIAAQNRAIRRAAKRKGRLVECKPELVGGMKLEVCKLK